MGIVVSWFCMVKGEKWWIFDRLFCRSDLDKRLKHKLDVLESLHRSRQITDFDRESSTAGINVEEFKNHINKDWFGYRQGEDGGLEPPGAPDLARRDTIAPTGAWKDWAGDAEGIVRETLIRAIEVSLGLSHLKWNGDRQNPLADYRVVRGEPCARNWPIEFWCVGPVPVFQGSVTWRQDGEGGRVIVTWLLPSAANPVASDFSRSTGDFIVNPANPSDGERFGSWIIAQQRTAQVDSGAGGKIAVSTGEPVVVSPSLKSGGVEPNRED